MWMWIPFLGILLTVFGIGLLATLAPRRVAVVGGVAGLLLIVALVVLASVLMERGRWRVYRGTMKSDLRNLALIEEEYFRRHQRFTTGFSLEGDSAAFAPSTGVHVVVEHADSLRWNAKATHEEMSEVCTYGADAPTVGSDSASKRKAGGPQCGR